MLVPVHAWRVHHTRALPVGKAAGTPRPRHLVSPRCRREHATFACTVRAGCLLVTFARTFPSCMQFNSFKLIFWNFMWFLLHLTGFHQKFKTADFKKRVSLTRKCISLFWFLMEKKVAYFYFCHIYIRTRVTMLCSQGSVCQGEWQRWCGFYQY